MKYILTPYSGINICETGEMLFFGMTSEMICEKIGEKYNYKMDSLEYFSDFRVDYDSDSLASAFEFFPKCKVFYHNDLYPLLNDVDLFYMKHDKLAKIIRSYDPDYVYESGIISLKLGIGTYYDCAENGKAESIILFKHSYYEWDK